jgi:hypothetical protein
MSVLKTNLTTFIILWLDNGQLVSAEFNPTTKQSIDSIADLDCVLWYTCRNRSTAVTAAREYIINKLLTGEWIV